MLEEISVAISFGLIPIGLFLIGLYVFHLIRAPVFLKFEKMMEPCLRITRHIEQNLDLNGKGYAIEIENFGLNDAKRCHARLLELRFETQIGTISLDRWPPGRDLHWSGQVENAAYYDVPGGSTAILNIVYCEPLPLDGKDIIKLAYRSKEQYRVNHALPQERGAILATIKVSCEGHTAINVVCRINPKAMVDTAYRAMSSDKPFELI